MLGPMEVWAGLLGGLGGAIVGGLIAIIGQRMNHEASSREQFGILVLEQCAQLIAQSEDYRNRIWEERKGFNHDAVASWDLAAHRMAQARLRLLCTSQEVLQADKELQTAGVQLGRTWRTTRTDGPIVEKAWAEHRIALDAFMEQSASYVSGRMT
jgi:hypothetical protein